MNARFFIIIILLSFISIAGKSQPTMNFKAGLSAGGTIGSVKPVGLDGFGLNKKLGLGFSAGLFTRMELNWFYLQLDVAYNMLNASFKYEIPGERHLFAFQLSQVNIPLTIGFKFLKIIRVFAGISPSFNVKAMFGGEKKDIFHSNEYPNSTTNSTDWFCGVGVDLGRVSIDAKYIGTIKRFYIDRQANLSVKSSYFAIALSYAFLGFFDDKMGQKHKEKMEGSYTNPNAYTRKRGCVTCK